MKSKAIEDYFPAKFSDLKSGIALPFDVYLYFSGNSHVVTFRNRGEMITDGWLDKYSQRGLSKVWIHKEDARLFAAYCNGESPQPADLDPSLLAALPPMLETGDPVSETGASQMEMEPRPADNIAPVISEEAASILEALDSLELSPEERRQEVASQAQALVAAAAAAVNPEEQASVHAKNRQIIKDVMDELSGEAESLVAEIWKLADIDPDLEHAVNVATYSVIFAMAFGRIDRILIADLGLAGLVHDIGICQVSAELTRKPWKTMSQEEMEQYSRHVESGLELVQSFAPNIPERVKTIIRQHHEKFDGSGYPQALQGFKVDDISQLLSIADLLDSISSGQWDGTVRTVKSTFELIEKIENHRTFPEHFNPDIFAVVAKWTRTTEADETTHATALETVKTQTLRIFKESA